MHYFNHVSEMMRFTRVCSKVLFRMSSVVIHGTGGSERFGTGSTVLKMAANMSDSAIASLAAVVFDDDDEEKRTNVTNVAVFASLFTAVM